MKLKILVACAFALFAIGCAGGEDNGAMTEAERAERAEALEEARGSDSTEMDEEPVAQQNEEPVGEPDDVARDDGKVALCNDGGYSDNEDFRATCSGGDGIDRWLSPYGECKDGRVIAMSDTASCRDNDGFRGLMPSDFQPIAGATDVALCVDGTFSDNDNFSATCSSASGVEEWLAPYVQCSDGTTVELNELTICSDGPVTLRPDYEPPVPTSILAETRECIAVPVEQLDGLIASLTADGESTLRLAYAVGTTPEERNSNGFPTAILSADIDAPGLSGLTVLTWAINFEPETELWVRGPISGLDATTRTFSDFGTAATAGSQARANDDFYYSTDARRLAQQCVEDAA